MMATDTTLFLVSDSNHQKVTITLVLLQSGSVTERVIDENVPTKTPEKSAIA